MIRFSLQLLSETFLILRRTERDMIKNVYCLNVKYLLFLSDLIETISFSNKFSKNSQISIFVKIHSVGTELFHPDRGTNGWMYGRTDMTKLIIASLYFANASKNKHLF
jgi:hypothetical protein